MDTISCDKRVLHLLSIQDNIFIKLNSLEYIWMTISLCIRTNIIVIYLLYDINTAILTN